MRAKLNFRQALPMTFLSASLAMVACDLSSETTVPAAPVTSNTLDDSTRVNADTIDTLSYKNLIPEQGQESSSSTITPSNDSLTSNSSSSSLALETPPTAAPATHCFESWYGAEGIARISTGYDAGFDNSGYWYTYNDSLDGGKSTITWAANPDEEYGDLEPVLEACGNGMCGTYKLDKGDLDYDPFVEIAFDLAGKGADGQAIPVDISGMEGIDILFSSSHAAVLELSLGEEMDKKIGYALPAYDLGKSPTGKYASIPWSKFAQPSWAKGDQIISIDEAITSVASIRVRIQAKTGSEGQFNIMGIGRRGTLLTCCGP